MQVDVKASSALISQCRRYRYKLTRTWARDLPPLVVIGLNPSTADARQDDPTIRRCIRFANNNGYGRLIMLNLFGLRSADPAALDEADDPEGPQNMETVVSTCNSAGGTVLAAWGAPKTERVRRQTWRVTARIRGPLWCLGQTKDGSPRHPLYVKASKSFEVWREFRDVR